MSNDKERTETEIRLEIMDMRLETITVQLETLIGMLLAGNGMSKMEITKIFNTDPLDDEMMVIKAEGGKE